MIGKLVHDKKAQWEPHLPEFLQAYNSTLSAVTSYLPHYLMSGRHPCLPIDYYFLMVSAFECSHCVPTYMTEVTRCFKEAYAEAHLQMNCKAEKQKQYYNRAMSTVQLVLGNVVLMKNNAYQGKWKVKDWWNETEYVACQVADGIPAFEVKDEAGNVRPYTTTSCFLWPPQWRPSCPWGVGASISEENVVRSTLVEHTSFEVESDLPEGSVDGADTLSPTSRVLLGWVGGVLQPLLSVASRPTMWRGL